MSMDNLWLPDGTIPRRIVIMRALQLGDLLCTVPAFRALRFAFPHAEIVLVGLPWAKTFVERFTPYIDGFIAFPGYPGLAEREPQIARIPAFLASVQNLHFDLAFQMHGNGSVTNALIAVFGAKMTAGYVASGAYCPDPERFMIYPDHLHEVHRHLQLLRFLGISAQDDTLEFPVLAEDWHDLHRTEGTHVLRPGHYIVIHPGARAVARRWSPRQFAYVADTLAAQGLAIVLTGSAEEKVLTHAVATAMKAPALDLAGQTSLGALAALLASARVVVCNDTGVSHIAAAVHVPSVVIFSDSDPARWAPYDARHHRVVRAASVTAVDDVLAQAFDLLGRATLGQSDGVAARIETFVQEAGHGV